MAVTARGRMKEGLFLLVFLVFFIILTAFGMKAPFSSRNSCIQRSKAAHIVFLFGTSRVERRVSRLKDGT